MRKHSLRRTIAGILAVLTVTGNLVSPGLVRLAEPAALVAQAADIQFTTQGYAFEDGTLYIKGATISKSNGSNATINLNSSTTGLTSNISAASVTKVVIMDGTKLPSDSSNLFRNFTNLTSFVIEDSASFNVTGNSSANISNMFYGCSKLEEADFSGLTNGNRVSNKSNLFYNCTALKKVDLSSVTGYAYDTTGESNKLVISGNMQATGSNENQNINLSESVTGIPNTLLENNKKTDVNEIVVTGTAVFPQDSNRLFKGFTGLKTFEIEDGARIDTGYQGYGKFSSLFEGCENLLTADLSGLSNGGDIAYIDGIFMDCTYLVSADLSSITGEKMGTGGSTQGGWLTWSVMGRGVDPVNDPTNGDDNLKTLILAPSFIYNTIENMKDCYAAQNGYVPDTLEEFLEDFLEGCENAEDLAELFTTQYNEYKEYLESGSQSIDLNSNAIEITAGKVYDGTAATVKVTNNGQVVNSGYYNLTIKDSSNNVVTNPVNAGTYSYTISAKSPYTTGNAKTGSFTISKAPLTIAAENKTIALNASIPEFTFTYVGFVNGETPAVLSAAPSATTEADGTAAGTYPIVVSGAAADNYDIEYINGELTVEQQAVDFQVMVNGAAVYEYAYTNSDAVITVTDGADTVYTAGTDYDLTITKDGETVDAIRDAGDYVVTVTGKGNYSGDVEVPVKVNPAEITGVTAEGAEATYDGNTYSITVSGLDNLPENAEVTYTVEGDDTVYTTNPAFKNAGTYNVTVKVNAAPNYNEFTADATVEIAKKDLTITADDVTVEYGQTVPELSVSYDGLVDGDTVLAEPYVDADDYSGVGTYEIKVNCDTDAYGNYNISTESGWLEVEQTEGNFEVLINNEPVYGFDYNGTDAAITVKNRDGENLYTENIDYTLTITKGDETVGAIHDAGTYLIHVEGIGNYNDELDVTVTVAQKALKIKADDLTITAGETVTFTVTYDGLVAGEDELATADVDEDYSNVGEYEINVSVPADAYSNYNVVTEGGTLTVTAIAAAFEIEIDGSETYNGNAATIKVKDADGNEYDADAYELTITKDGQEVEAIRDAGTYTVTVSGKGNYSGSAEKVYTVAKADLKIKADDQTITAGQTAEFTVTYDGLVAGEDELATADVDEDYSNVGEYEINVSVPADAYSNYNVVTEGGTLTVTAIAAAFEIEIDGSETYNGNAATIKVKDADGNEYDADAYELTITKGDEEVDEIRDAGTYTVTVSGKGNYSGSAEKVYTVEQADAITAAASTIQLACDEELSAAPTNFEYTAVTDGSMSIDLETPNEDGTYNWTFTPDDENYKTATGTVTIKKTDHEFKQFDENAVVWTRTDDGYDASYTFECDNCDESEPVAATLVTVTDHQDAGPATAGYDTYTATFEFQGDTYTATHTDTIAPSFIESISHSVLFSGKIGINYYVKFVDGVEAPTMTVWRDNADPITVNGVMDYDDDGNWTGEYRFSYYVCAPEMSETMYCTFAATLDGEEVSTTEAEVHEYSVQEYVEAILKKSKNAKMINLAATLANYGAYTQLYFEKDLDNLPNANVNTLLEQRGMTPYTLDDSAINLSRGKVEIDDLAAEETHAFYDGQSVLYEEDNTMRFYVTFDETVKVSTLYLAYRLEGSDGEFKYAKVNKKGNEYKADIKGIKGPDMTDRYEVYFCTKSDDGYTKVSDTLIFSVEAWCVAVMQKSQKESTRNLAMAMMKYCYAAREFFNLDTEGGE